MLILLGVIAFGCSLNLSAQKVELSLQSGSGRGPIEIGEQFYVYVTLKNIDAEPVPIRNAGGAEVVYWTLRSSRSSVTSINGRMSQSVEKVYAATLIARKKGNYTIDPITVGGYKSNALKYSIVDAGSNPDSRRQAQSQPAVSGSSNDDSGMDSSQGGESGAPTFIGKGNEQLFLRANVSKTTVYEQEALVYTVKLYTTYSSIKFIGATEAPKFDGFVIEESNAISNQLTFETYQGKQYATAVIARYIIFPQMSGKLRIIGNKYTVSTDANEYYHDPMFMTLTVRRPIQLNVSPNDLEVNVKPLPTPRPANFSGGVGKFSISSALKSDKAVANQAGSITYTVSGEGNLKYIHLPELNAVFPDAIEVFSPTTDVQTSVGANNVSGSVKFDYSFMPLEQGSFTIPEVELVYFNPATEKYETTRSKSYRLTVGEGTESSKSQATLTFNSNLMNVDVDSIAEQRPEIRSFVYWLAYIIPLLILIATAIWRRQYIAEHADMMGMRSKRAGKLARKRLKKAAKAMNAGNQDLFYDEILKAVWGYLSDKLRLPTSELSRENVSQILDNNNMDPQFTDKMLKLLDECELEKYSPASSRKAMTDIYSEATDVLNGLQTGFEKSKSIIKNDDDDKNGADIKDGESKSSNPANISNSPDKSKSDNIKVLSAIAIMLMSVTSMFASSIEADVRMADDAYNKGEYSEAIRLYEDVIKENGVSAPLLFNLGCAYYKTGNEGEARLYLERAKRLDPSNKVISQDISYIQSRVDDANKAELKGKKGNVLPDQPGFFKRAQNKIAVDTSSDAWANFAVMAFILLILSAAGYIFSPSVRFKKIGFFSGLIFLVFTVIFVIFSEMAASHFESKDEAIITSFKITLTSDPLDAKSEIGFPLNRGTKVTILESQLNEDGNIGWYKVMLNSSNIGWIPASDITVI